MTSKRANAIDAAETLLPESVVNHRILGTGRPFHFTRQLANAVRADLEKNTLFSKRIAPGHYINTKDINVYTTVGRSISASNKRKCETILRLPSQFLSGVLISDNFSVLTFRVLEHIAA